MAIIVTNESSLQGDPTEEAIRKALAGMDLASVQDSTTASRYAVSSVDQGNVPTLVGAQVGGNSGTQGGKSINVIGRDSVQAVTTANLVTINLLNDALAPGNTYYYGTGPTGTKGWNTVASSMAVASTSRLTKTIGANGVSTFDLAASGVAAGTYGDATHVATFTVDAYGRLTAASNTPIAVIPQGYIDGLQMVWNSATSISVTSGTAYIPSLGNVLVSNATLTLSGLVLTASTWYHVYLYSNAGVPAIECVTTAPVLYDGTAYQKTGDNTRRYLGSVRTQVAGSNIIRFDHAEPNHVMYMENINNDGLHALVGGTATVSTTVSCAAVVPVTSRRAQMYLMNTSSVTNGATVYVSAPPLDPFANLISFLNALVRIPQVFLLDSGQNFNYLYDIAPDSGTGFNAWVLGYYYQR